MTHNQMFCHVLILNYSLNLKIIVIIMLRLILKIFLKSVILKYFQVF